MKKQCNQCNLSEHRHETRMHSLCIPTRVRFMTRDLSNSVSNDISPSDPTCHCRMMISSSTRWVPNVDETMLPHSQMARSHNLRGRGILGKKAAQSPKMVTCVAVVSRLDPRTRECILRRTRPLSLHFATFLLSTTPDLFRNNNTSFSTVHLPATHEMRGLLGSSAGSRDSKKRFVAWAAHQRSCEYLWHLEEDTMVTRPRDMLLHFQNSTADLISTTFSPPNAFYIRHCKFCQEMRIQRQVAWPALRISRTFARQLYDRAMQTDGHHEPFTQAVCDHVSCVQEELLDADIRLPRNLKEHRHDRNTNANALFVHPNKCAAS